MDPQVKEQLVKNVRDLIELNREITTMKSELKGLTLSKKGITDAIMEVMKESNIDCFQVSDGILQYRTKRTRRAINAKNLLVAVKTFLDSGGIDSSISEELVRHVMETREEVIKDELQCKFVSSSSSSS